MERLLNEASCPTCGQEMASERRARNEAILADLKAEGLALRADGDACGRVSSELRDWNRLSGSGVGAMLQSLAKEERGLSVELTKIDNEKEKIDEQIRGHDTEFHCEQASSADTLVKEEGGVEREIVEADGIQKDGTISPSCPGSSPTFPKRGPEHGEGRPLSGAGEGLLRERGAASQRPTPQSGGEGDRGVEKVGDRKKKYTGLEINSNYGLTILDEKGERVGFEAPVPSR